MEFGDPTLCERHVCHKHVDVPARAPKVRELPVDTENLVERQDKDVVGINVPVHDPVTVEVRKPPSRVEGQHRTHPVGMPVPLCGAVRERPARIDVYDADGTALFVNFLVEGFFCSSAGLVEVHLLRLLQKVVEKNDQ